MRTANLAMALAATVLTSGPALAQTGTMADPHRPVYYGFAMEELEYRYSDRGEELLAWDGDAFLGTDELKARWIARGEYALEEDAFENLENQLVAQTPVSDFFDAKAGVRFDTGEGPDRTYAVVGVVGLAPYWFEVDASLYASDEGDVSAEFDAEYELLLTNRLILAASLDATLAFSEDREIGLGRGLSSTEAGLRLSYDLIDRSFSPYVGVVHERKYGDTRDFAEAAGGHQEDWFAVAGARLLF